MAQQAGQATANSGTGGGVDVGGILSGAGDLFGGLFGGISLLKGNAAPPTIINQPQPQPMQPYGDGGGNWMMYAIGVVVFIFLAIVAYKMLSK